MKTCGWHFAVALMVGCASVGLVHSRDDDAARIKKWENKMAKARAAYLDWDYTVARERVESALSIAREVFPADDVRLARTLFCRVKVSEHSDDCEQDLRHAAEQALRIYEGAKPSAEVELATAHATSLVGSYLKKCDDTEGALAYYIKAFERFHVLLEQEEKQTSIKLIDALWNIALLYREQKDYGKTERYLLAAIAKINQLQDDSDLKKRLLAMHITELAQSRKEASPIDSWSAEELERGAKHLETANQLLQLVYRNKIDELTHYRMTGLYADILRAQGRTEEAAKVEKDARSIGAYFKIDSETKLGFAIKDPYF